MSNGEIERRILDAHQAGDGERMALIYAEVADLAEAEENVDRACFFLTQAWIFALEAGLPLAVDLRSRLVAYGRVTER